MPVVRVSHRVETCAIALAITTAFWIAPASAMDLSGLLDQANKLSTQAGQLAGQAGQVRSMIPGQDAQGAQARNSQGLGQQASQQGLAGASNSNAGLPIAANGQSTSTMPVLMSQQMQWRADGCFFSQPQEITCQVTVANQGADKKLGIRPGDVSLIDSQGTEYRASAGGFGQNEAMYQTFANGVSTVGVFRFRNVDPNTSAVKRFGFISRTDPLIWSDVALNRGGSSGSTMPAAGGTTSALTTLASRGISTATPATTTATASAKAAASTTVVTTTKTQTRTAATPNSASAFLRNFAHPATAASGVHATH